MTTTEARTAEVQLWTTEEINGVLCFYRTKVYNQTVLYNEAVESMKAAMAVIELGIHTDSGRIKGMEALEDAARKAQHAARMISWHEAQLETAQTLIATETANATTTANQEIRNNDTEWAASLLYNINGLAACVADMEGLEALNGE